MITTCTRCGALYEAGSEEQAYERDRFCFDCRAALARAQQSYEAAITGTNPRASAELDRALRLAWGLER